MQRIKYTIVKAKQGTSASEIAKVKRRIKADIKSGPLDDGYENLTLDFFDTNGQVHCVVSCPDNVNTMVKKYFL